jgi:GT2 family glycosyltransferase
MKLSVIIVNYNVKYFLEQCLYSVYKSLQGIESEIIVIDNDSSDGSEAMVRHTFHDVKLIVNDENIGFSKANNIGIKASKGEYILILNPDTIIEENTLRLCIDFMDRHPKAGSLGPKMIDGKGNFLPESKRGLPTPRTAFFKITGIHLLFPKSGLFNRYYMGNLPLNATQEVDVLTGAFFFTRRSVLDRVGLFDEAFFMYGEDIDLSYRIAKSGYSNFYFPETTIIHYKGESTKRGSINYVLVFYKAMKIFTTKHFKKQNAWWFTLLIELAIYFRAFLSVIHRLVLKTFPLFLDAVLFYLVLYLIANLWETWHFQNATYYAQRIYLYALPIYITIWLLSLLFFKSYTSPFKILHTVKGILTGTIIILVIYALLPEHMRYSRAIIILGSAAVFAVSLFTKFILHLTGIKNYTLYLKKNKKVVVVGKHEETSRIEMILLQHGIKNKQIDFVYPSVDSLPAPFLFNISSLNRLIIAKKISEVIFCAHDLSTEEMIRQMKKLTALGIDFKIASPGSAIVIGSNSSKTSGDIYSIKLDSSETSN